MKKGYEASSMTIEQLSMAIKQLDKERNELVERICTLTDDFLRGGNVSEQLNLAHRELERNCDTFGRLHKERALKLLAATV